MIGIRDTKPATQPTKPASKLGEAGELVGKAVIGIGDDLVLSKKAVTPAQVAEAFDRLEQAQRRANALGIGTLGGFNAYKRALEEVKAAKAEIDALRKAAPDLVKAEEASRNAPGLFHKLGESVWTLAKLTFLPLPLTLFSLFKKD